MSSVGDVVYVISVVLHQAGGHFPSTSTEHDLAALSGRRGTSKTFVLLT
jgi:hypothetical protein